MSLDWAKVESIEGWLSKCEGEKLYDLARDTAGNGIIVEIGSWKGWSS